MRPRGTVLQDVRRHADHRPLVFLACALALGVCAGRWADIPAWTMWLPALVALAAFCLAAWRGRRWCWLALLPGMLCAGVLRWQAQQIPFDERLCQQPQTLICRVSDLRPYGDNQMRVTVGDLFIDGKSVPGKGVFELDLPLTTAYVKGDQLRLTARFSAFRGPRNPGGYDAKTRMQRQGVVYHLYPEPYTLSHLQRAQPDALVRMRTAVLRLLDRLYPEPERGILGQLLLGKGVGMDEQVREQFAMTGTAHILAVSGLHVGYLIAVALGLLRLIKAPAKLKLASMAALLAGYCALTGMSASVIRASIMGWMLVLSHESDRGYDSFTALGAALIVLLLMDPWSLFDAGLQMSFLSVMSIVALSPALMRMLRTPFARLLPKKYRPEGGGRWRLPRWLAGSLSVSLAATAGLALTVSYYYQQVQLAGPVLNLVVVPLGAVWMLGGWLSVGLAALAMPLGQLAAAAVRLSVQAYLWLMGVFAQSGWLHPAVPTPPAWTIAVTAAVLVAYMPRLGRAKMPDRLRIGRRIGALVCVAAVLAAWWGKTWARPARWEVTYLDTAGQAALLRTADGRTYYLEADQPLPGKGTSEDVFTWDVLPYLRQAGIMRIDGAVVDRAGRAPVVAGALGVDAVTLDPGQVAGVRYSRSGDYWDFDDGATAVRVDTGRPGACTYRVEGPGRVSVHPWT
ncbi:MAG: ComEC/Rec2 family competence protein [Christensenellales bacterium]|jgi:competence protein ComEC